MTVHLSSALSKGFNDGYRASVLEATECPTRRPRVTWWDSSWHKHTGEAKAEQQIPVSVECIDTQQLEGVEWFQVAFKGQATLFSPTSGATATGSWPCHMQPVRCQAAGVNLYVIWLSFGLLTVFVHPVMHSKYLGHVFLASLVCSFHFCGRTLQEWPYKKEPHTKRVRSTGAKEKWSLLWVMRWTTRYDSTLTLKHSTVHSLHFQPFRE